MLCQYKNVFGKPGTGAHKYRFCGLAIVDILATIIVAYLTKLLLDYFGHDYNYLCTLLSFFLLGIFMHRLFCVRTPIDKLLFPK